MAARRYSVVLGLVPLRGENHFNLRPQNRILVPVRGILANHNAGFG